MNEMAMKNSKMGVVFGIILAVSAVVLGAMTTIF